jgi:hypothetical protein
MTTFSNYNEWRSAITGPCGITLSRDYCEERIAALQNDKAHGTQPFIETYGAAYCNQVIEWFRQALSKA